MFRVEVIIIHTNAYYWCLHGIYKNETTFGMDSVSYKHGPQCDYCVRRFKNKELYIYLYIIYWMYKPGRNRHCANDTMDSLTLDDSKDGYYK